VMGPEQTFDRTLPKTSVDLRLNEGFLHEMRQIG
jgi:hypothetical protein